MSAFAMKHFDLLNFVKNSKELGMSEPLAEYQGRQIEEAMEMAIASSKETVEGRNLVTQQDLKNTEMALRKDLKELELKIKEAELRTEKSIKQVIMWMIGLFIASGVITHFLK
jgi:hypothetical protein